MKKLLLLATLVLGVVSCMKDQAFEAGKGGESDFVLSVALPSDVTRAVGQDSALGAVDNKVIEAGYDVRYTLEVYDDKNNLAKRDQQTIKETATSFALRLIPGRNYRFVVWADFVKDGVAYYNVEDLRNVYLRSEYNTIAMDESLDAYTSVAKVEKFNAASTVELTLTRPFAKLRVVTNDMKQLYEQAALVSGTVVYNQQVYTTFNALTAEAGGATSVAKAFAYTAATSYDDEVGEKTLFADYLFGTETGTIQFTLDVEDATGLEIDAVEFNTTIPVKRNHLTTIYGPVLTDANNVSVRIDDNFELPEYEYNPDGEYYLEADSEGDVTAVAASVDGLVAIAEMINEGELDADTNVALNGDIDLSDFAMAYTTRAAVSNWVPVGTSEKPFTGTFDGRGYTIKNLTLVEQEAKEGKAYIGFFGYAKNATIKNVTFENVYINIPCLDIDHSQGHIGAVAGSLEGTSTIENVTVKGDVEIYATQNANGASRVAVIAGGNAYGDVTMKNVHVIANEGSYLIANNNTGALAGQLQGKMYFENCSSNIDVTVNKFFAGGLVGIAAGDSKFVDCHTSGDIAVVAGREGRANDHYRVGGIAGGWADGKTKVCTLVNCSYTGKVSGKNSDGSVAEVLDYAGYVGRGYTLSNCAGSTVVVNGMKYVQAYDKVYGVYYYNGAIMDVAGVKAVILEVEDGFKAVSVEEKNLKGVSAAGAATWAEGLGEGWSLASIYDLDAIHAARKALNVALAADNAENALFCETDYYTDGKYALYISSTAAEGNDPQGQEYFSNRVHVKYFNLNGYWDYPYSTFATINVNAPLKDNYFARAVYAL